MRKFSLYFVAFYLFFIASIPFSSVSAAIIINEIFYDAEGSDEDREWVELYNPESAAFDLSGWKFLESSTKHSLTLSQGTFSLDSGGYAIIAEDASTFISDHPSFSGNLYDSSFSLSNTGETLSLISEPSGDTVESVTYSSDWGGGSGLSIERTSASALSNQAASWQSGLSGGSPGTANALPTPTPTPTPTSTPSPSATPTPTPTPTPVSYPSGIFLSEFMPNPEGDEKEWVEIYNSNSAAAELTDWLIDDQEGGSSPQSFTEVLPPLSYRQFFLGSNKLNNDGDTVRLLRSDLSVADSYSYSSSQKGAAWAKETQGNWLETSTATPNEANKFSPVGGSPHQDNVLELKKLVLGSKIELTAFVSVPLDVFSDDEFYVVDDYSGIKISVDNTPEPKPKLGDKVHVASTIEESYSEKYIKSDAYEVRQTDLRFPNPVEVSTGEVTEPNEGKLVKIKGKYQESDGDSFYIDDGTGSAKVYLKSSTGIIKLKMDSGDEMEVQGVVSQYGFLKDGQANYRLMPRFQSDMRNLTEEQRLRGTVLGAATELPVTGGQRAWFSLGSIALGLILKVVLKFSGEVRQV